MNEICGGSLPLPRARNNSGGFAFAKSLRRRKQVNASMVIGVMQNEITSWVTSRRQIDSWRKSSTCLRCVEGASSRNGFLIRVAEYSPLDAFAEKCTCDLLIRRMATRTTRNVFYELASQCFTNSAAESSAFDGLACEIHFSNGEVMLSRSEIRQSCESILVAGSNAPVCQDDRINR